MDYEHKYLKYKNKYLNLKNKIIGGTLKIYYPQFVLHDKYKIIINIYNINETSRDGYNVIIDNSTINNIIIRYVCKILTINIFIENAIIKTNKELTFIDIENIKEIKKININDLEFSNVRVDNKIIKYMLMFDENNESKNNIFDICISHIDSFDNSHIEKFISILVCNKIRLMYGGKYVSKYFYLLLFIYEIMFYDENKKDNSIYDKYSKKLFKLTLPIYLPHYIIKIQNSDGNFIELTNKYNFILDTGNSGYTNISKRFFKIIRNGKDTVCKKANTSSYGLNRKYVFNYLIKFKIELYKKSYLIMANINSDLDLCNDKTIVPEEVNSDPVDILFGMKSGINLFFKNDFVIGEEGSKHDINEKITYKKYIDEMNDLLIEICEKININATFISNEIINFFMIHFFDVLARYNLSKNNMFVLDLNIDKIRLDYEKLFVYSVSVIDVLTEFKVTYNLVYPYEVNFYSILDENEYDKFIEKRFNALSCTQEIIDSVSDSKFLISNKFSSFIELLSKLMF